jgi:hypothetical protein
LASFGELSLIGVFERTPLAQPNRRQLSFGKQWHPALVADPMADALWRLSGFGSREKPSPTGSWHRLRNIALALFKGENFDLLSDDLVMLRSDVLMMFTSSQSCRKSRVVADRTAVVPYYALIRVRFSTNP